MFRFLTNAPVLALGLLVACGGPKGYAVVLPDEINPSEGTASPELQEAVKSLTDEDRGLLTGFLMRRELGKSGLGMFGVAAMPESEAKGITVGKAIELQRAWVADKEAREAQEKALASQIAAAREAKMESLRTAVTVSVASKVFRPHDFRRGRYEDDIALEVGFINHTDKTLAGVKGTLVFADLFGEDFKRIGVAYDKPIEAGAVAIWKGFVDTNQFNKDDTKLAATELDRLKVRWEPDTILFADGVTAPMTASE
jgi:hypothetical protein